MYINNNKFKMSNNSFNTLCLVGVAAIGAGLLAHNYMSKDEAVKESAKEVVKEGYHDTFTDPNFAQGAWVSRPTFKADLDPRFDAYREGGGNIKGAYGEFGMQAAPIVPVGGYGFDMAKLGSVSGNSIKKAGGTQEGYATPEEVKKTLQNKFGKNVEQYTSGQDLMPTPTMTASDERDPSDPNTFIYTRYIFAPLKRRYGQTGVDFTRGDLPIAPLNLGWFSALPPSQNDVVQGYFAAGYDDIQQSTNLKDSVFTRKYPMSDFQQNNPFGDVSSKQIYNLI